MNNTLCQTAKLRFIDENSAQIFKEKEHVLVAISPFNSYYSRERIEQILVWVLEQNFKNFHVFLADEIYHYNFLAIGYSEKEAKKKTQKEDKYLHGKVAQIFDKYQIPKDKILPFEYFKKHKIFEEKFQEYQSLLKITAEFQVILYDLIAHLILQKKHEQINYHLALQYCMNELPILLNTPEILGVKSSFFTYHRIIPLHEYLYRVKKMSSKYQSFLELSFYS